MRVNLAGEIAIASAPDELRVSCEQNSPQVDLGDIMPQYRNRLRFRHARLLRT